MTQLDKILKFSDLPLTSDLHDFSEVGINQLIEFKTSDFKSLEFFDRQVEHIKERAKELNAEFVVHYMGKNDIFLSNNYLMKFKK
jgi:hypothetical protein